MAPENTIVGFIEGMKFGYRALETDVMLAQDKIPVLMHDPKFGRTVRGVDGGVPDFTASQIQTLDAGSWYSPRYCGVTPPSFENAVRWCRANRVWMNIEIKPAPGFEYETGEVVGRYTQKLFEDLYAPGRDQQANVHPALPLFSSFKVDALRGAKASAPYIPRGYLIDEIPDNWRETLQELACVSLHTNWKRMTPEFCREVKDLGYWLFCWTPNDPIKIKELFSWGVDAVCTDRLDLVPAYLA